MFKVGDYVMINRNAYKTTCYREELNEMFFKIARITEVIKPKYDTYNVQYRIDIAQKYDFYFAFSERFLIDLKEGV